MTKLTLKQAKATLPANVAEFAVSQCKEHRTNRMSFQLVSKVYLDEDGRYTAFEGDKCLGAVRVGGEWAGPTNAGLIAKDMAIPVGAFVVEGGWFLGKYFVTVYHNNGQAQIR